MRGDHFRRKPRFLHGPRFSLKFEIFDPEIQIDNLTRNVFDSKEFDVDSAVDRCDEDEPVTNDSLDRIDHLTCTAFEEDLPSTNTIDEVYSSGDMVQDNILDQEFDSTRLSVGDVFFDGNNGDTCDIEDYTLGWVEVVAIHRRSVYLSPIYSPQERPFVPKSLEDLPVRAREDVIDPKYFRPTEVESLLGDSSKAKNDLGWHPKISFEELVKEMVFSDFEEIKKKINKKTN